MAIDQAYAILFFCAKIVGYMFLAAFAKKMCREISALPRGTWGNGKPERRKRTRLVLPDPATLTPRQVAPGTTI